MPPKLPEIRPLEEIRNADIPSRRWYVQGTITTGLNILAAKKRSKKSFLAMELGNAIASGGGFAGLATCKGRVLLVNSELDLVSVHARAVNFGPFHPDLDVCFEWASGEMGLEMIRTAIVEGGYSVIILDMMTALATEDLDSYAFLKTTRFWNRVRRLGQENGVAIVGLWHSGKSTRSDAVDEVLSSTGLVGQCDSILNLRRRGETRIQLLITGNHAQDQKLDLEFVDFRFQRVLSGIGTSAGQGLKGLAKRCFEIVCGHQGGISVVDVAKVIYGDAASGSQKDAVRKALGRMEGRVLSEGSIYRPAERPTEMQSATRSS